MATKISTAKVALNRAEKGQKDMRKTNIELRKHIKELELQREDLHKFLDAAAVEGFVLDGVDAADLYISIFTESYEGAMKKDKS